MFLTVKDTIEKSAPVAQEKASEPKRFLAGPGMDTRKN